MALAVGLGWGWVGLSLEEGEAVRVDVVWAVGWCLNCPGLGIGVEVDRELVIGLVLGLDCLGWWCAGNGAWQVGV